MKTPNDIIWFDRKFEFVLPVEMYPVVIERLRGTPARLDEKLAGLSESTLTAKPNDLWSIKEQVGHLGDLFKLWNGRIDDFLKVQKQLRPADVTNSMTKQANHNATSIGDLLNRFRSNRAKLVARLEQFDIEGAGRTARHPRLDQPMRLIDNVFFVAEHDDHHLAKIHDLIVG